jgi:hypothetical protein
LDDGQEAGRISFFGDSSGNWHELAYMRAYADDYSHASINTPTSIDFYVSGITDTTPNQIMKLKYNNSVLINSKLGHLGDEDTYMNFTTDQIEFRAGNAEFARMVEATQDAMVFNNFSGDIDFRFGSDTYTHALFVRGSDGRVGIGQEYTSGGRLGIVTPSTWGSETLTLDQDDNDRPFIRFNGSSQSTGDASVYSGSEQYLNYDGAIMVYVNGTQKRFIKYFEYSGLLCPRVDAWDEETEEWVEVGRAIYRMEGKENKGKWGIGLNKPYKKFRLVEDEPEISYIDYIKGVGAGFEAYSLKDVVTSPASYFGATDGSIHYFEFDKPVTELVTYGYYERVEEQ